MRRDSMRYLNAFTICALLMAPLAFAGSLTPPGAPAATMKTLQEVYDKADEAEARTPIASVPYTISQPGSYYLAQDLNLATQDTHGITISASDVTIDLNGFCLTGPGKAVGSSGHGIYAGGSLRDIAIRNGTVRDWREDGVYAYVIYNGQFESLRCYNNGGYGLRAGLCCTVHGNTCYDNGDDGIFVYETCTVIGNASYGNGGDGIYAYRVATITNNSCSTNDGNGIWANDGAMVIANTCRTNYGAGIKAHVDCRVVDNTCHANGFGVANAAGIEVTGTDSSVERNLVVGNDTGIDCSTTTGNFIAANRAAGNSTDYSIATGNLYGQIVDGTSGGVIGTTDPYTNFSF